MEDDAAADEVVDEESDSDAEPEVVGVDDQEIAVVGAERVRSRRWPTVGFGVVGILALAGLVGWLGFRTYQSHIAEAERDLFLQVGRQGAVNLTTIDYEHAEADVQRILDSTVGTFHDNFAQRSQIFIAAVKDAQSKSVGTVSAAGLESEGGDEARVVVAVTVKASTAAEPEQQPQAWRMRLTVHKVGDEAKVTKVEFVR